MAENEAKFTSFSDALVNNEQYLSSIIEKLKHSCKLTVSGAIYNFRHHKTNEAIIEVAQSEEDLKNLMKIELLFRDVINGITIEHVKEVLEITE
jgi:hypothetical protein